MKNFIKIIFILIGFSIIGTFVYSLYINHFDFNKASVLGYKLNNVLSGSMSPVINTDDYVLSKTIKYEDIKIGDIITYQCKSKVKGYEQYENAIIIHRVIEKNDEYLITKGDANEINDPWNVYPNDIISKCVYNINTTTKL